MKQPREALAELVPMMAEVLDFQSSGKSPTIHDYGRWRRSHDAAREALASATPAHAEPWPETLLPQSYYATQAPEAAPQPIPEAGAGGKEQS